MAKRTTDRRAFERGSPICSALRSKATYALTRPAQRSEEVLDGSGRCWCRHTMASVGPDGQLVHPDDCRARRACFEPPERGSGGVS